MQPDSANQPALESSVRMTPESAPENNPGNNPGSATAKSTPAAVETVPADLRVERGMCYAMFAFDIGAAIDLEQAQRLAAEPTQRETLRRQRSTPRHFDFQPLPVRISQPGEKIALGPYSAQAIVDVVLYDFGAVSVIYAIDLAGPVASLAALSGALYENAELAADARRRVQTLMNRIAATITKPNDAPLIEDYLIYHIESLSPPTSPADFVASHAAAIAAILRSEDKPLSEQEIDDALACRLAYSRDDLSIIDWQAAMILGRDVDDVRAVLEFANVELLEMRFLDDQLDKVLDQFHKALSDRRWRPWFRQHGGTLELRRLGRLQMESAVLFEEVNNALKLLGDQFLARVYRLAAHRLHIPDWDASILRKLQTIESMYSKLSDYQNTRRMELLEWIIILLIAVSIFIAFLPGKG